MRYIKVSDPGDSDADAKDKAISKGVLAAVVRAQARGFLENLLLRFIPRANPDFENLYSEVVTWWLEVDESGAAKREIGFDKHGKALVFGPVGNNYGLWTDGSLIKFDSPDEVEVSSNFQSEWNRLVKSKRLGA